MENHSSYNTYLPYWKQIRIFNEGLKSVQEYLQPVTFGVTPEDVKRNKYYKERAKYTNFTGRTRNSLLGAAFRKEPTYKLPTGLEYILDNADGMNKPLIQQAKHLVTNLLEVGRHGLLCNFDEKKKLAKIVTYSAENILDWEEDSFGLTRVVLFMSKDRYKHLLLVDDIYQVEIRNEKDEIIESYYPTDYNGNFFKEIPFVICGSTDNSPDVDDMPLWSIVDVSQGHYQNSADYEDIMKYMLPTPWMNGMSESFKKAMYPTGFVEYGSGAMLVLPPEGQAGLLQANANQIHSEAMKHKEEQLIALGARLITSTGQAETATAVKIKFSAENSVLANLVQNASSAIEVMLQFSALFMGIADGDIEYRINEEFFDTTLTAQEITAQIMLLDRGVVAKKDLRGNLRKTGMIESDRTDEEIEAEAEDNAGGLA